MMASASATIMSRNSNSHPGEFLLMMVALALAIMGGGKYALDRVVFGI